MILNDWNIVLGSFKVGTHAQQFLEWVQEHDTELLWTDTKMSKIVHLKQSGPSCIIIFSSD